MYTNFPTMHAHDNGCSQDDVDCHRQWRRRKLSLTDILVPCCHIKMQKLQLLCAFKYALVEGSGITETWLAQNVVPHILFAVSM